MNSYRVEIQEFEKSKPDAHHLLAYSDTGRETIVKIYGNKVCKITSSDEYGTVSECTIYKMEDINGPFVFHCIEANNIYLWSYDTSQYPDLIKYISDYTGSDLYAKLAGNICANYLPYMIDYSEKNANERISGLDEDYENFINDCKEMEERVNKSLNELFSWGEE